MIMNEEDDENENDYQKKEREEEEEEEEEKIIANKKITKIRKNKKKSEVEVLVDTSNKSDQSMVNNINSPLKEFRKSSTESKKNANIPNKKINNIEVFNKNLTKKPLLIITNKQDLPQAYSSEQIAKILGLYYLKDIKWYIRGTSCVNGEGVNECLDWVIDNLTNKENENISFSPAKKSK